ncbi:MAG: DUF1572 family protein [Mucilaginibacter sp.]|uniref:DUF1572 family protein n=1 Tax=Mucilaginibacter sp. TaxID=1882438 RepID=UPI0032678810
MEKSDSNYLKSSIKLFQYYKSLGDTVIDRLDEQGLHWQYNQESNSVAIIIQHISGNSLSRWSDFLKSDGEKESRDRDAEFEETTMTKPELTTLWNKGWQCLFEALNPLSEDDLTKRVYIRNEGHTVLEAINRQLAHLPYHVGQMVFLGRMITSENWTSLTIPKGESKSFNKDKFSTDKKDQFFTDGIK